MTELFAACAYNKDDQGQNKDENDDWGCGENHVGFFSSNVSQI